MERESFLDKIHRGDLIVVCSGGKMFRDRNRYIDIGIFDPDYDKSSDPDYDESSALSPDNFFCLSHPHFTSTNRKTIIPVPEFKRWRLSLMYKDVLHVERLKSADELKKIARIAKAIEIANFADLASKVQ